MKTLNISFSRHHFGGFLVLKAHKDGHTAWAVGGYRLGHWERKHPEGRQTSVQE